LHVRFPLGLPSSNGTPPFHLGLFGRLFFFFFYICLPSTFVPTALLITLPPPPPSSSLLTRIIVTLIHLFFSSPPHAGSLLPEQDFPSGVEHQRQFPFPSLFFSPPPFFFVASRSHKRPLLLDFQGEPPIFQCPPLLPFSRFLISFYHVGPPSQTRSMILFAISERGDVPVVRLDIDPYL